MGVAVARSTLRASAAQKLAAARDDSNALESRLELVVFTRQNAHRLAEIRLVVSVMKV